MREGEKEKKNISNIKKSAKQIKSVFQFGLTDFFEDIFQLQPWLKDENHRFFLFTRRRRFPSTCALAD